MERLMRLRKDLGDSIKGADSALAAADQLCNACVGLLDIDGASVSLMHDGTSRGTFGSSGAMSRRLDEYQFTFGEGPCFDAVTSRAPVLVPDLTDPTESRWPAFRGAVLDDGVEAVFALPVSITASTIGALDLYRRKGGALTGDDLSGGMLAAELAALPLLDLMTSDVDWDAAVFGEESWDQLASLERVEVYQAIGMLMAALDVDSAIALVQLRARAFVDGMTASEVAWEIIERRLSITDDHWYRGPGRTSGPSR